MDPRELFLLLLVAFPGCARDESTQEERAGAFVGLFLSGVVSPVRYADGGVTDLRSAACDGPSRMGVVTWVLNGETVVNCDGSSAASTDLVAWMHGNDVVALICGRRHSVIVTSDREVFSSEGDLLRAKYECDAKGSKAISRSAAREVTKPPWLCAQ